MLQAAVTWRQVRPRVWVVPQFEFRSALNILKPSHGRDPDNCQQAEADFLGVDDGKQPPACPQDCSARVNEPKYYSRSFAKRAFHAAALFL